MLLKRRGKQVAIQMLLKRRGKQVAIQMLLKAAGKAGRYTNVAQSGVQVAIQMLLKRRNYTSVLGFSWDFPEFYQGTVAGIINRNPYAVYINAHSALRSSLIKMMWCLRRVHGILRCSVLSTRRRSSVTLPSGLRGKKKLRNGRSQGSLTRGQGGVAADGRHGGHACDGLRPFEARPHSCCGGNEAF